MSAIWRRFPLIFAFYILNVRHIAAAVFVTYMRHSEEKAPDIVLLSVTVSHMIQQLSLASATLTNETLSLKSAQLNIINTTTPKLH